MMMAWRGRIIARSESHVADRWFLLVRCIRIRNVDSNAPSPLICMTHLAGHPKPPVARQVCGGLQFDCGGFILIGYGNPPAHLRTDP